MQQLADVSTQGKVVHGESWLQQLKTHDYNDLSFEQRVNILWTLVHLALDGPAVRSALEGRIEEAQRIRKQMWEEAKVHSSIAHLHCYKATVTETRLSSKHLQWIASYCVVLHSTLCIISSVSAEQVVYNYIHDR